MTYLTGRGAFIRTFAAMQDFLVYCTSRGFLHYFYLKQCACAGALATASTAENRTDTD